MDPDAFAEWAPDRHGQRAEFAVRLAMRPDIDRCVEIAVAIGAGEGSAWRETFVRTVLDGVDRALFVADSGTEVVGYGRVVHAPSYEDPAHADPAGWYLLGVAVDPRWQRQGIGEALTEARMRWVAQRADRVYYFTHQDNHASQLLHQRLGFVAMPGSWLPPGGTAEDAHEQRLYVANLRDP